MADPSSILPDSLNLPPHLSAHKYFFVCTLTVAAWDTLVLSPRGWRLFRTKEWPILKIFFHILRFLMPIEFTIVGVAFFDTKWSQATCRRFFLFEPICTAVLLAICSAVHVIRIHAIYDKSRAVLSTMSGLLAAQIVVTAVACGFFRSTPLKEGQGCIASPKHNWVGIYWVSATLLYTVSLVLAINRSYVSLAQKPLGYWKLMLRDGLNLYAAIFAVNLVNVIFWFVATPTGPEDPIKTIVSSMAAVLTTSMTLRIILSVRGSLVHGGSFAVTSSSNPSRSATHAISARGRGDTATNHAVSLSQNPAGTFNVPLEGKGREWVGEYDGKSDKEVFPIAPPHTHHEGVKITVATETDYDSPFQAK